VIRPVRKDVMIKNILRAIRKLLLKEIKDTFPPSRYAHTLKKALEKP